MRFKKGLIILPLSLLALTACAQKEKEVKTPTKEFVSKEQPQRVAQELNERKKEIKKNKDKTINSQNENKSELKNNSSESIETNNDSEFREYARVWSQYGSNQDIDELHVKHIAAGTPLNPEDETNVNYPEDVIRLVGGRLVDGMITYSSNGNGTINIYNVPNRWYGGFSRPENVSIEDVEKDMKKIIEDKKTVNVKKGNEKTIKKLIDKININ